MKGASIQELRHSTRSRNIFRVVLLISTCVLSFAALVAPLTTQPSSYLFKVGEVATQDILAPQPLSYESKVLTDQARNDAESRVTPVYLPIDPSISRRQIERLRVALAYISTVRGDAYASRSQQKDDFKSMIDLQLSNATADAILNLNDGRWQTVTQESSAVLEQILRNTVREDQLTEARRSISTYISFSLPQEQAELVGEIVAPFIAANSLYSPEQSLTARVQARQSIPPIMRTFISGETIVLRGQLITAENLEALQEFGLVQPRSYTREIASDFAMVLLLGAFLSLYFYRRRLQPIDDLRGLLLVCFGFVVFLSGARFLIPNRVVLPFLYPLPAFALTMAALYNLELGLFFSLALSVVAAFGLPNSLSLTLFYIFCSMFGVLVLGRARRISSFIWSGVAIGCAGSVIILAYRLTDQGSDWIGIATLVGAAFFNGIASASITLVFQFLFSQILGLTTALQLLEFSRPDHPLLQFILRNAPGTYQHSLQVSNLAEQAAESIGADALLVRVGAIYHDVGKAANPQFFIENQVPGKLNPHDDLDPITSATTIIQHITDGQMLARKHRLPPRIRDFISEHHGTLLTRYQFTRAVEAAGNDQSKVNPELFRYPGPRPRSRETALLMLADGVEARARAELPKDEEELRILIKRVFDFCQKEGQLDDTRLSLRDLNLAAESFVNTLQGTYHPRIRYPELRPTSSHSESEDNNVLPPAMYQPPTEKI